MTKPIHVLIVEKLTEAKFEAQFVGGCVRDELLGVDCNDYDITTNATPEDIAAIFQGWNLDEVGKNFGVMLIEGVEVATYRSETYNVVSKPDVVLVGTFLEDSSRRDFTINAMGKKLDGTIVDYHGGQEDLKNKVIRAVGQPIHRFTEDPSRILRCLYLAARLSFSIEEETLQAIKDNTALLKQTPVELVGKILMKVLKHNCLHRFMILLAETGTLEYVFPELCHTIGMPQNPKYHDSNVYDHILRVIEAAEKNRPGEKLILNSAVMHEELHEVIQLSAALHDVAKGLEEVRGINKDGQPNDLNHEEVGVPIAEKALIRLQFGKSITRRVSFIVRFHGIQLDEKARKASIVKIIRKMAPYQANKEQLRAGIEELFMFMNCDLVGFEPSFREEKQRVNNALLPIFREVLDQTIFYRDELPINGRHLMEWGIEGKQIGEVLEYLVIENVQDVETVIKRLTKRGLISVE